VARYPAQIVAVAVAVNAHVNVRRSIDQTMLNPTTP
jgi:hypothetical protein